MSLPESPPAKHDDFLAKAEEADRNASGAIDPGVARNWAAIAESYRALARQVVARANRK